MDSDRDTLAGGLPHSEIRGSKSARLSPRLFAACHVLRRLSVPRHPPDALLMRLIATTLLSLAPAHALSHARTRRLVKTLYPQGDPTSRSAAALPPERTASVTHTVPLHPVKQRTHPAPPRGTERRRPGQYSPAANWDLPDRLRQQPTYPSLALAAPAAPLPLVTQPRGCVSGGGERDRTDDLLLAKQALSQLSYTPKPAGAARRPTRRQR
jgi:hypothetical protein